MARRHRCRHPVRQARYRCLFPPRVPLPAQALIAVAEAQAQAAIAILKAQAAQPGDAAAEAAQALERLSAEAAAGTAPSGGQPG